MNSYTNKTDDGTVNNNEQLAANNGHRLEDIKLEPIDEEINNEGINQSEKLEDQKENSDPVVFELPVILTMTKDKLHELFLMQFPDAAAHLPVLDTRNVVQAKVKPDQGKLQLIGDIDTASDFYDQNKGAALDNKSDDGKSDTDELTSSQTKHVMESTTIYNSNQGAGPNLTIGILEEEALYVTPLAGVLQMNTAFPHLEEQSKETPGLWEDIKTDLNDASVIDGQEVGEPKQQQAESSKIQVRFTQAAIKDKGDEVKHIPRKHSHLMNAQHKEAWVNLSVDGFDENVFEELTTSYEFMDHYAADDIDIGLNNFDMEVEPLEFEHALFPNAMRNIDDDENIDNLNLGVIVPGKVIKNPPKTSKQ